MNLQAQAGLRERPTSGRVVRGLSLVQRLVRLCLSRPLGALGGALVLVTVVVAIGAPLVAPSDPYAQFSGKALEPPGPAFVLGTDQFGRDVLSRVIWGARISLYVGILSTALGTTSGAFLGLLSGYFSGRVDLTVQRLMDVMMAFPSLVLALALISVLGPSLANVIIAIGVVLVPTASRVLRSTVLTVKETQYVDAARAIGASHTRVLLWHVMPNCLAPYIVLATSDIAAAILTEASLSFLGLGTPPPIPTWGGMMSGEGKAFMEVAPWLAVYPGLAITLALFGFNFLGDAIRDAWDPRLRRG